MSDPIYIGGVACKEMHDGSGKSSFDFSPDNKQLAAQQVFVCPWGDRYTVVNALRYAEHPDILFCYATTFDVAPWGKSTGYDSWESAKITVGYKNFPFKTTDYKEVSVDVSAENVSCQSDGWEFEDGASASDKRVDVDPQQMVSFAQITIVMHNQSSVNEPLWASLLNKVNSGEMHLTTGGTWYHWPAGHVLYLGYSVNQKVSNTGISYEVTHKLIGNFQFDHRAEFNPHAAADPTQANRTKVKHKATGEYKYKSADLTVL